MDVGLCVWGEYYCCLLVSQTSNASLLLIYRLLWGHPSAGSCSTRWASERRHCSSSVSVIPENKIQYFFFVYETHAHCLTDNSQVTWLSVDSPVTELFPARNTNSNNYFLTGLHVTVSLITLFFVIHLYRSGKLTKDAGVTQPLLKGSTDLEPEAQSKQ